MIIESISLISIISLIVFIGYIFYNDMKGEEKIRDKYR